MLIREKRTINNNNIAEVNLNFENNPANKIPNINPEKSAIVAMFQFEIRFMNSQNGINKIITIKARFFVTIRNR
jgi:hypothetical protein